MKIKNRFRCSEQVQPALKLQNKWEDITCSNREYSAIVGKAIVRLEYHGVVSFCSNNLRWHHSEP